MVEIPLVLTGAVLTGAAPAMVALVAGSESSSAAAAVQHSAVVSGMGRFPYLISHISNHNETSSIGSKNQNLLPYST